MTVENVSERREAGVPPSSERTVENVSERCEAGVPPSSERTVEEAWADFHERMKAVGEQITGDEFPGEPRMRAEGFRYLNRLSLFALQLYLEFSDPARPAFMRFGDDVLKWGATNVDNHYLRARVTDAYVYRVTGNTTGVREMIISTHDGDGPRQDRGRRRADAR